MTPFSRQIYMYLKSKLYHHDTPECRPGAAYNRQWRYQHGFMEWLVHVRTKPLPKPTLTYYKLDVQKQNSVKFKWWPFCFSLNFPQRGTTLCLLISFILHCNVCLFNTLRPRQNDHHFADGIFNCIFFYKNVWISIKISLNFVPKSRINNIPALVQIMAWCRRGDTPLSEPMFASLLTHICITRPQWVNEVRAFHGPYIAISFKFSCTWQLDKMTFYN